MCNCRLVSMTLATAVAVGAAGYCCGVAVQKKASEKDVAAARAAGYEAGHAAGVSETRAKYLEDPSVLFAEKGEAISKSIGETIDEAKRAMLEGISAKLGEWKTALDEKLK